MNAKIQQKMQATYIIQESQHPNYVLYNTVQSQKITVQVKQTGPGQGEFVNLPQELQKFLFNFKPQDIFEDTCDVINVLITMFDSKGDGQSNLVKKMPTDDQFADNLSEYSHLISDDPSKYYDIVGKLG